MPTRLTEIAVRQSEIREQMNADEELPDEKQTELRNESKALEAEFRTLALAEDEAREKREADSKFVDLRNSIECRNYLAAATADRPVAGREAEFNKEVKLDERATMPWEALVPPDEADTKPAESRADVAVNVPDEIIGKPRMTVIERVLIDTDSMFCGVSMPAVSAGEPNYPVMTAGASGGMAAKGAAQDAETTTFTGHTVEPSRAQARYLFSVEDQAKFGNDLESVLRRDCRRVMGKLIDDQYVAGNGIGANLKGFLHADNVDDTGVTDPAAASKPTDFDAAFADEIDGLYALSSEAVKLLIGIDTQKYLAKTRADSAAASDGFGMTYLSLVNGNPHGGMRATQRVTAPVSDIQDAYAFRPAEIRAIGPVWQGIQLIRDPYSNSASGQVALTMLALIGYVQPRGKAQEVRFHL